MRDEVLAFLNRFYGAVQNVGSKSPSLKLDSKLVRGLVGCAKNNLFLFTFIDPPEESAFEGKKGFCP